MGFIGGAKHGFIPFFFRKHAYICNTVQRCIDFYAALHSAQNAYVRFYGLTIDTYLQQCHGNLLFCFHLIKFNSKFQVLSAIVSCRKAFRLLHLHMLQDVWHILVGLCNYHVPFLNYLSAIFYHGFYIFSILIYIEGKCRRKLIFTKKYSFCG